MTFAQKRRVLLADLKANGWDVREYDSRTGKPPSCKKIARSENRAEKALAFSSSAIFLLIFNIYYYRQNDEALSRTYLISFSLILGGAVGNLIDRIF